MYTNRKLSYSLAINEALKQLMEKDDSVFVLGQGVKSPWYVGNTCKDLIKLFGEERVIDTPISENAMTGAAVGASLNGMKPIIMHPRVDFALYAFDPIINQAANWYYMNGGKASAQVVFWLVVNRGGEQAAQHSQSLHSLFTHIPGLKVISPSTAYDVKGLLTAAINDPNPVVFIDDRWLYGEEDEVPNEQYEIPIGKAIVRSEGSDVTIVSSSYLMKESSKAAIELEKKGISVELIDLRTLKPLDEETIINSVTKTGRLVLVDGSWKFNSITAEISAIINEKCFGRLKVPVCRINLPDAPAPASRTLETEYYINKDRIISEVTRLVKL
jgi:acetoin:2,6-dichlorophenolindophenol oxidoreductase subunit beta